MKDIIFLYLWRLISLLAIVFFVFYYFSIQNMIEKDIPKKYLIIEIALRKRYSSSIGIEHNNKYYSVNVKKSEALNYKRGDSILLYYNCNYDYFYVPNTIELYLRYIYASVFSLFMSFIPWRNIKKKMEKYNRSKQP